MTGIQTAGARLVLRLTKLEADPAPAVEAPRQIDLDTPLASWPTTTWVGAVRVAPEPCILLDGEGRVSAASPGAASLLGPATATAVGSRFLDLVTPVDFTSGAGPDLEPERTMAPLRALGTGGLARGLMRLRGDDGSLVTYDVVAVPLSGHRGVLAFFVAV